MTPKEKAKELTLKFMKIDSDSEKFEEFKIKFFYAQRCALIAVAEIISSNPHSNPLNTNVESTMEYWQQVKQEIQAL
jgi:hypothetical protein